MVPPIFRVSRCLCHMCYVLAGLSDSTHLIFVSFFFFFKQKTAYEMLRSLVGSEMCIRDRFRLSSSVSSPQTITGPTIITDGYTIQYLLTVDANAVSYTHLTLPTIYSV